MSSLFRFRTLACLAGVAFAMSPACVIRLADRNAPEENGGVTGAAADCSEVTPPPKGAPGGEAAPKLVGRFAYPDETPTEPVFDWSGNYITASFTGTTQITVKLLLPVGPDNIVRDQLFTFVVDGQATTRQITVKRNEKGQPTSEPEEEYEITGLSANEEHEVTIYKNTEAQKGTIVFRGFDLRGGTFLPPIRRARRMEFIGDSIICGYGNEGKNATCPFEVEVRRAKDAQGDSTPVTLPVTENQYLSFTAIAARAFDADAVTVCWSGKGAYKNYKEKSIRDPETGQVTLEPDTTTTVPQLWESRTVGNEIERYKWDFAKEKPDEVPQVVFISLGTNDFSRDTDPPTTDPTKLSGDNIPDGDMNNAAERQKFFETYLAFVQNVRARRPDAHIFVATPPMVTDQYPLENARQNLKAVLLKIVSTMKKAGDAKVYQMDLVEQGFRYGLGCDYHPNLEVHRIMATQLIGAVRSKTCW